MNQEIPKITRRRLIKGIAALGGLVTPAMLGACNTQPRLPSGETSPIVLRQGAENAVDQWASPYREALSSKMTLAEAGSQPTECAISPIIRSLREAVIPGIDPKTATVAHAEDEIAFAAHADTTPILLPEFLKSIWYPEEVTKYDARTYNSGSLTMIIINDRIELVAFDHYWPGQDKKENDVFIAYLLREHFVQSAMTANPHNGPWNEMDRNVFAAALLPNLRFLPYVDMSPTDEMIAFRQRFNLLMRTDLWDFRWDEAKNQMRLVLPYSPDSDIEAVNAQEDIIAAAIKGGVTYGLETNRQQYTTLELLRRVMERKSLSKRYPVDEDSYVAPTEEELTPGQRATQLIMLQIQRKYGEPQDLGLVYIHPD